MSVPLGAFDATVIVVVEVSVSVSVDVDVEAVTNSVVVPSLTVVVSVTLLTIVCVDDGTVVVKRIVWFCVAVADTVEVTVTELASRLQADDRTSGAKVCSGDGMATELVVGDLRSFRASHCLQPCDGAVSRFAIG